MKTLTHVVAAFVVLLLDWMTGSSRTEPVRYGPLVRLVTKHPWTTTGAVVTALGVGAAAVVASGVVSIRASSGHWAVTEWLLDFAKLQSVRTYSLGLEAPRLDDGALIVRGAAHYAVGCETCHGSPDVAVPPVMRAMTPPPPELKGDRLTRWTPAQLFSIIKHGIKFTGMPAWPAQPRDDEVWAVVAFLTSLPHTNGAEYRRLVGRDSAPGNVPIAMGTAGSVPVPDSVRLVCVRCHGEDGTGRGGLFPSLAGQRANYLYAALQAFKNRSRHSATMSEVAVRLKEADMRTLASYYEQLPRRTPASGDNPTAVSRGALIATQGAPQRDIPACVECHGPSGTPRNSAYPRLAGQHAQYLVLQLDLLKQRRRGGSPRVNLMHTVVDRLDAQDISDVARYYASLSVGAP